MYIKMAKVSRNKIQCIYLHIFLERCYPSPPPPTPVISLAPSLYMNILDQEQLSLDGQTMEKNALAAAPVLGKQ